MPWLETDVRDQRIQFVLAGRRPGANISALCRAFGVSRKTAYKWLHRERMGRSVSVLGDQSRRPRRSPHRTSDAIVARVVALRQQHGWGGEKLAWLLAGEGITITGRTIDRIIRREGLTREDVAHRPAPTRFERAAPNDLWQMDAKGAYPLRDGRCHPLCVVDDHSRYAVGVFALSRLAAAPVRASLIACFEQYGVLEAMLMDHGSPWWASASRDGLTTLSVFLLKQGIRLIYGAVRHPQTQGKVERFHRTLGEYLRWHGVPTTVADFERRFAHFQREYNDERPHAALGMQPPRTRFQPSPRAYQVQPTEWEYPGDWSLRRVTTNGGITISGRYFFVSEALIGETVACQPFAHRWLVSFRHMYVRELHLRSHRSVPLLQPVDGEWPAALHTPTGLDEV
jgi:transposase InsO family protein